MMMELFKHAVIPNAVRDLTNGLGSHNQICVTRTSSARSFSRDCGIRMTRIVL